jgi:hypothetical protein
MARRARRPATKNVKNATVATSTIVAPLAAAA